MFWRFGGYANISSLDTILDKPDVTVEELLDESDLIQELKQQNSKLIEFLRDEPVLHKLLHYITAQEPLQPAQVPSSDDAAAKRRTSTSLFGSIKSRSRSKSINKSIDLGEPEEDKREAQRKKYAYVAAEVLSSEVWSITEALLDSRDHLREFWSYMKSPAPLDALQASYFTKVNETLLDKKTEEMFDFLKSLDGLVPQMLQHVDCPMIMDLLLKMISLEKHEGGQGIVDWLQSQDLIPVLLSYLSPDKPLATQTSAGDFLKAIITISANATTQDQAVIGPNELTRQLVSEQCVATLIADMLHGGNPLTVGVGIIIEVIRKNNSDYDLDNQLGPEPKTSDPIYLGTLLRQFAKHVPDFMNLIRGPSAKKPELKAAFGDRIQPLGFDRFKTCELMAELLHCSNMGLLNERGSEAEIFKRDAEREKLKAEGKLAAAGNVSNPEDAFASSVDSHGFHHAQRPEDYLSDSPDDVKRLEVQNASDEDGFEKVTVPDTENLPDEVSFDDFGEKTDLELEAENAEIGSESLTELEQQIQGLSLGGTNDDQDQGKHRVSLLTQQIQDQIEGSDLGTLSDEHRESAGPEAASALSHPEDKPAPLFARKSSPTKDVVDPLFGLEGADDDDPESATQSIATLQQENFEAVDSLDGERSAYEPDLDGSPVIGDVLKMQFVEHQVVPTILDFFFRFPWNNFLHNVVYDVVQQVFNGTLERGYNRTIALDLFADSGCTDLVNTGGITKRILDGQAASEKSQKERGMRLGYMGHLTLISEEVCKFADRNASELLGDQVMQRVTHDDWIRYVESTLAETREKDNAVLGGVRPENAMNARQQTGFSSNNNSNSSALASAGLGNVPADSLALQDAGVSGSTGYGAESSSNGLLSGFGDGDDDDDDLDEGLDGEARRERAVSDDEQAIASAAAIASLDSTTDAATNSPNPNVVPPPLNIPPSRARRQLAARLAARNKASTTSSTSPIASISSTDPDAADPTALALASTLPTEPAGSASDDIAALDLSAAAAASAPPLDITMRERGHDALASSHQQHNPQDQPAPPPRNSSRLSLSERLQQRSREREREGDWGHLGREDAGSASSSEAGSEHSDDHVPRELYGFDDGEGIRGRAAVGDRATTASEPRLYDNELYYEDFSDEEQEEEDDFDDDVGLEKEREQERDALGIARTRPGGHQSSTQISAQANDERKRRPSTTEAKVRTPLEDDDADFELGSGRDVSLTMGHEGEGYDDEGSGYGRARGSGYGFSEQRLGQGQGQQGRSPFADPEDSSDEGSSDDSDDSDDGEVVEMWSRRAG